MSKPAIQVEGLSKQYLLGGGALGGHTLREMLAESTSNLLSRIRVPRSRGPELGPTSDSQKHTPAPPARAPPDQRATATSSTRCATSPSPLSAAR
jgi:hypothetical protein